MSLAFIFLGQFRQTGKLGSVPGRMAEQAAPLLVAYERSAALQSFVTLRMSQLPPTSF